jgi:hypothetical protein
MLFSLLDMNHLWGHQLCLLHEIFVLSIFYFMHITWLILLLLSNFLRQSLFGGARPREQVCTLVLLMCLLVLFYYIFFSVPAESNLNLFFINSGSQRTWSRCFGK